LCCCRCVSYSYGGEKYIVEDRIEEKVINFISFLLNSKKSMYINTKIMLTIYTKTIIRKSVRFLIIINGIIGVIGRVHWVEKVTQTKKANRNGWRKDNQPLHNRYDSIFVSINVLPHIRRIFPQHEPRRFSFQYVGILDDIQTLTTIIFNYQFDELLH